MARIDIVSKREADRDLLMPRRSTKGSIGHDLICAEDTFVPSTLKHFLKEAHLTGGVTKETLELADSELKILKMEQMFHQRIRPTLVPTGIKVYCEPDEYFAVKSRSSFPLKYMFIIANGEGVVDSDYADNPKNEGEVFVQFLNLSPFDVTIPKGTAIAQGMFIPTITPDNDNFNDVERVGGHGSTGI